MLIRPVTERTFQRALLTAAGLVCVASGWLQSAGHLGPKSGKIESFRAYTHRDSRQLDNPEGAT